MRLSLRLPLILLCLIAGTLPYVLFRQEVFFLRPLRHLLPAPLSLEDSALSSWLLYNFSDICWYMALLLLADIKPCRDKASKAVKAITIALPFILELGQKAHLISGTFDILDIASYLIILTIYISLKWSKSSKTKPSSSSSSPS